MAAKRLRYTVRIVPQFGKAEVVANVADVALAAAIAAGYRDAISAELKQAPLPAAVFPGNKPTVEIVDNETRTTL